MSRGVSRRVRLTLFVLFNLTFWLVMAIAAGLLISDEVDLGLETMIRHRQATVVAMWQQLSQNPSRLPAGEALPAETRVPAGTGPGGPAAQSPAYPPGQATEGSTSGPQAQTAAGALRPSPVPASSSARPALPSDSLPSAAVGTGRTGETGKNPTPGPEQPLLSAPLLMSDPEISNLERLNTELGSSAPGRAVQIRYAETTLNREITALLQDRPALPYRDVQVDLKRDQVVVTGKVTILGFRVGAEVVGTMSVQQCLPQIEIQTISISGVLTPGFVKDEIKEMILEALAWYPADHPLCLEQIVLEETRATVYGYRR